MESTSRPELLSRKAATSSVFSPPAPTEVMRAPSASSGACRSPRGAEPPAVAQRFPPIVPTARISPSATCLAAVTSGSGAPSSAPTGVAAPMWTTPFELSTPLRPAPPVIRTRVGRSLPYVSSGRRIVPPPMTVTPAPSPKAAAASAGEVGVNSSGGAVIAPPRESSQEKPGAGVLGPLREELRERLEIRDVVGRVVAHGAVDLDEVPARVAQVELHVPVLEHAHVIGEHGIDDAELLGPQVDREDVVDRDSEVMTLRRLVVLGEDVELRVAEPEPVDTEAEVRCRKALRPEAIGVEARRCILVGRRHTYVIDPQPRHRHGC